MRNKLTCEDPPGYREGPAGKLYLAYLRDPDGNGVELYWDRPAAAWPRDGAGGLAMVTDPFDLRAFLTAHP